MKSFIIYISLLLTVASHIDEKNADETKKNEITKLTEFFEQIRREIPLVSKNVFVDGKPTTIDTFFMTRKIESLISYLEIKSQGIYEISHLFNTVLSCEYSYFTYFLIKIIENVNHEVTKNPPNLEVYNYHSLLFERIQNILSSMVLTLANLAKYTKNVTSKNHDMLTILLSWHMFIEGFVNESLDIYSPEVTSLRVESIKITNYQVDVYLKQFTLNNCQTTNDYTVLKNDIDGKLTNVDYHSTNYVFETKCNELKPLLDRQFLDVNDQTTFFVLTTSKHYFTTLIDLINRQLPSEDLKIYWNQSTKDDLTTVYDAQITAKTLDIKTVLNYERSVLQIITKIIIIYMINVLTSFTTNPDTKENKRVCDETLIKLDYYIQLFKDDDQPSYLINNMSMIKADLWIQCLNIESTSLEESTNKFRNYIHKMKKLDIDVSIRVDINNFEPFLESLSETVICTKLHPLVSNIFWEKLYLVSTKISKYVVDYKYLYMMYEDTENATLTDLCEKIEHTMLKTLKLLEDQIIDGKRCLRPGDPKGNKKCFDNLNSLYLQLKNDISEIIFDKRHRALIWKQILLTLIHNMTGNEHVNVYESFDDQRLLDLQRTMDLIHDYVQVGFRITCKSEPSRVRRMISDLKIKHYHSSSHTTYDGREVYNTCFLYKNFYRTLYEFVGKVANNSSATDNNSLQLYWNGDGKTLAQVHDGYKNFYSFYLLRDHYDYLRFFVRWIIAVVYSRFVLIVNQIIAVNDYDQQKTAVVLKKLEPTFQEFTRLPLHIPMAVKQTLEGFVHVVKAYRGHDKCALEYCERVLDRELEYLGVVPNSSTAEIVGHYDHIMDKLNEIMDLLVQIFRTHDKEGILADENYIGIQPDVLVMTFSKWNR